MGERERITEAYLGCNCVAEVNAKLAEKNGELLVTWYPVFRPLLETQKLDTKKRGKLPLVVPTFCPFCGAKYPEPDQPSAMLAERGRGQ